MLFFKVAVTFYCLSIYLIATLFKEAWERKGRVLDPEVFIRVAVNETSVCFCLPPTQKELAIV